MTTALTIHPIPGVDLAAFDPATSLSLHEVCRDVLRGGDGRPLSPQMAQRYARYGCRPHGYKGPPLILPAVMWGHKLRTMHAWAVAFEQERIRLGMLAVRTGGLAS